MKIFEKTHLLIIAVALVFALYGLGNYRAASDAERLVSRGVQSFEAGKTDEAEQLFLTAATQRPSHTSAWLNLGIVRQSRGDMAGSVRAFEKVLEKMPEGETAISVRKRLVEIYMTGSATSDTAEKQQLARLSAHMSKLIEFAPADPQLQIQMGHIMVMSEQHGTALECFARASDLATASSNDRVHVELANIYRSLGMTDLAEKETALSNTSSEEASAALTE